MEKSKKIFLLLLVMTAILMIVVLGLVYYELKNNRNPYNGVSEDGTFSSVFIRESHSKLKNENYMISPYSVEIALSMLREGAKEESLKELNEIVPERSIKTLKVKDRVNVANAIFIKDHFKNDMLPDYMDTLDTKYNADVLYDPFKTPKKINDWVNQETNGMIPEILKSMDSDFVLGIANAVAMEEEWKIAFECESTSEYPFTKKNGKEYGTSMMFHSYTNAASFYEDEEVKAAILPYNAYNRNSGEEDDEGEQLDFIGILPNDLDDYVENFSLDSMEKITKNSRVATDSYEIQVGLPRFEFEFDYGDYFKEALIDMGIQSIFGAGCDLSGMIKNHPDMYVSEAIHKSYVKVNEAGTKAAAVTYFGTKDNAAVVEEEEASIIFNRPFVFIIKDHASNEILFFGVVYEPEKWNGKNDCE